MLSKKGRHTGTIIEFVAWKVVHNFCRDTLVKINVQWNLSNPDTLGTISGVLNFTCPEFYFTCPEYGGVLISGVQISDVPL